MAEAAKWPTDQWTLILMPYLAGLVQKVVDTMEPAEVWGHAKVKEVILGTLELSEEAYQQWFRELEYKPGVPIRTLFQRLKANTIWWLKLAEHTSNQVVKPVIMEQVKNVKRPRTDLH